MQTVMTSKAGKQTQSKEFVEGALRRAVEREERRLQQGSKKNEL